MRAVILAENSAPPAWGLPPAFALLKEEGGDRVHPMDTGTVIRITESRNGKSVSTSR